ncbi:STAS-like domain-containing protein [Mammaliicoccus sciuri]|uniref:STAS-like domain-containing protein n=1 Tax=Mammaliicoccus sciuri TaxID=1296 RepID=UPI001E2A467F|nr:DUF4325 domain-containing protein [Mammaliicoccus sciuri]MCD3218529.1 STAS-like domain-containing protein [Mammaliicoccus sciuri]MCJ0921353.1 STAS-like domain-containing protein [Mammaliicoccus sciuri]MEB7732935.1 STAS-like domain-containing protein [Mammaliicoccus sciuri]
MGRIIKIANYIDSCTTNDQGRIIKELILLDNDNPVKLSFKGIDSVTTSFVNSLFVDIMFEKGMDFIKNNINIVESNTQINRLIVERLKFEKENRVFS